MTRTALQDRLRLGVLFLDGAMGTQLIEAGAPVGQCNDYLNIESPDIVRTVHEHYLNAGADAVTTNTFGANGFVLKRHGHAEKVYDINLAAAKLAREHRTMR
jgi:methionine synthase I (cobalamin-dependent)